MPRRILVRVLAVLLLAMQNEAGWHALTHFGERLKYAHEQVLQLAQGEGPCALCALFAGGTTAAPDDPALPSLQPEAGRALCGEVGVAAVAPSSFYLSRAPPTLL
jgi:hypothetical protein